MNSFVGISYSVLRLKSLKETPGNPQKMTPEEFQGMVQSMKQNGWILDAPVIWRKAEGDFQIISGHHRVRAGIEAGILETGCKVIEGLNDAQVNKLVLEANQRKGKFDDDLLNTFIDDIIKETGESLDSIYEQIGLYPEIELPKPHEDEYDIDFDNIEGTENREKKFKDQLVTCPNCKNNFMVKI